MTQGLKHSILTFFIFLFICLLGIVWAQNWVAPYPFLRVWDLGSVLILLAGLPFLFLQKQAGIPDFWDDQISNRSRIWIPALIGLGFGILDVVIIKGILHPEPYTELPPFLQPFPYSIFLYFSGAFEIEIFYRLIPIVLVLAVFSKIRQGKYLDQAFWGIAFLTALREPLEQLPSGETWFIAYALISGFAMNFIQAIYFRKVGFMGNLSLRLGHYLMWHILLGVFVEMVELG
jgi:hypothetical protein